MAVGKRCAPPRGGGSARNAIYYLLAEELTAKVEHRKVNDPIQPEQREGLSALMAEACTRPDRGADVIWSPTTGDGIRPSSIYTRGVTSLYTADIEIQAVAGTQTRCKSPVAHFIIQCGVRPQRSGRGLTPHWISTHTPAHASALGEAWRAMYRDTLG